MKKLILTSIIMLAIGGSIGFYIGKTIGFKKYLKEISQYHNDFETYILYGKVATSHSERAFNAYINEKPEIGIWAIEGLIIEFKILAAESTDKTISSKEDINFDLTLAYARLSKLYSKIGDQLNVDVCHKKALFYAKKTGVYSNKLTNIKMILDFTDESDTRILKAKNKI